MSITGPADIQLAGTLTMRADGARAKLPTFDLVANTGGQMELDGWPYPVVVDLQGAQFFKARTPLIADHDPAARIGHTTEQTIDASGIRAKGVVSSTTEGARQVVVDALQGYPFEISFGAKVAEQEFVPKGQTAVANGKRFTGPLFLAKQIIIRELSVLTLGADGHTSITIAAQRKSKMTADLNTNNAGALDLRAEENELARQDEIGAVIARYAGAGITHVDPADAGLTGRSPMRASTFKSKAIEAGLSPDKVELALLRAGRANGVNTERTPAIHVKMPLAGSSDLASQALSCAVARQFGMPEKLPFAGKDYGFLEAWGEQVAEASDAPEIRSLTSLHSMMDSVIRAESGSGFAGKRGSPAFLDAYVHSAKRLEAAGGAFSTLLVNHVLEDAANKAMLARFALTAPTWPEIAEQHNLDNFHPKKLYRADANLGLLPLTPQGEIVHGELRDTKRTIEADTVARMIALDRRHIVNDDLGAFEEIVRGLADGATWSIESAVYTVLLANADDFFHADNANLIDNPLGLEGLEAAETAFGSHVGAGGKPIGFDPALLLVGNGKATTGRQLLAPQLLSVDANAPAVAIANPFANKFRLVKSKYIDVTAIRTPTGAAIPNQSATKWFLLSEPTVGSVIAVGLLNGSAVPTIKSDETTFNTLGMQWRAHFDYGVAQGDTQFGVMSTGDGSGE